MSISAERPQFDSRRALTVALTAAAILLVGSSESCDDDFGDLVPVVGMAHHGEFVLSPESVQP